MAYNSSGALSTDQRSYTLGKYTFWLSAQYNESADTTTCIVICTVGGQQATRRQPVTGQVTGWYVEANETEASVYATIRTREGGGKISDLDTGNVQQPIFPQSELIIDWGRYNSTIPWYTSQYSAESIVGLSTAEGDRSAAIHVLYASASPTPIMTTTTTNHFTGDIDTTSNHGNIPFTYQGKTVYYGGLKSGLQGPTISISGFMTPFREFSNAGAVAWTMLYGSNAGDFGDPYDILIARFAIDLGDAGGYPGGSGGWVSPGDWNPDPTTTLHLTVNGALSGRHNDPLTDPSYSYVPADNTAQAGYGCGGDGGHGGGGGAGASTVIVRQFATNKANSKDITALAKRHGYGSGGGKGGKGGDGCILIYY